MINKNDYGSYEAPTSIVFGFVNEEVLCESPNGSWDSSIKNGSTWDNDDEDYGLE